MTEAWPYKGEMDSQSLFVSSCFRMKTFYLVCSSLENLIKLAEKGWAETFTRIINCS